MNVRPSQGWGAGLLVLLTAALGVVAPSVASADEAAPLYGTSSITVVNLNFSGTAKAELEAEPDEYVEGTFEASLSDGTPGGTETSLTPSPMTVGIRLKGSELGSFRPLSGKAAFKIKFKQFGGAKFLGLKKMTLNNMVEDPSMIHEALTYTVFRDLGIPAPRTGYTFLRVNGQPYGVYLDIEDIDDVALKRIFGAFDEETQHLYEGENGADVVPGGAADFEVDEGKEADRSDLEALIAAVNGSSPASFAARVAPVADLGEMSLMWAIEKYLGRWDGYAGRPEGPNQPNNYFLYSDPSGVFQMMPWGSDETWEKRLSFDGHDGLMFNLCIEDPACAVKYWEALRGAREAIVGLPLDQLATELSALLAPWQADDPRKEENQATIESAVAEVHDFIAERPGEAAIWLAANEPPAEPPPPKTPGTGVPPAAGEEAPPAHLSRIVKVAKRQGRLLLSIHLLVPGRIEDQVTVTTPAGRRLVCAPTSSSDTAMTLTLACRYPRFARQLLRQRSLRLRVLTETVAEDGVKEETIRQVNLARD